MLESMRNASQGIIGKAIMTVVMGLIIVSFVIWGVGDMLRGFTASTVATVGGAKISAQEYHEAYQRTLEQYQRRMRQPITNEQAHAFGLDQQVLQRMVSEAALDVEARKLGLNISEDAAAQPDHLRPRFPGQVRRLRSAALHQRPARQRTERAELCLRSAQFDGEAIHLRRTDDRSRRAEGRDEGGGRLPRTDAFGRLFRPPGRRRRRHSRAFRGHAQGLLQRPQVELPGAGIPVDGRGRARAADARQSGRRERCGRGSRLRQSRRQGPALRFAGKARPAADPVPESGRSGGRARPRSRPERASTTSSKSATSSPRMPTSARRRRTR